jgi:nitrogen fixation/metabolism regulation signal transduction histidine kinase
MKEQRKKIWIDRFQTLLFLRIAFYFLFYQVAVWSLVLIEQRVSTLLQTMTDPAGATRCLLILTLAVMAIGALFIYDAVKFTHRIVGPIYRLRQAMRAVAAGEGLKPITLRQNDLLQELKDEFNAMVRALEQRGAVPAGPEAPQDQRQAVSV